MSLVAPIVKDRLYEEVYCLKDMSMIHVDLGNIEVKKGESYYSYIGEEYLDEYSPQNRFLVKVGLFLWPFDKKHFGTLRQLRERKLNDLGI
jgi:hypothetical protein